MIGDHIKKYCKDDISKIENCEKAIASKITWHCHHRAEILPCGIFSRNDLKKFDLYYNRPANELIFLLPKDHIKLHYNDIRTIKRVSNNKRGRLWWNNGIISKQTKDCPGLGWKRGIIK